MEVNPNYKVSTNIPSLQQLFCELEALAVRGKELTQQIAEFPVELDLVPQSAGEHAAESDHSKTQ